MGARARPRQHGRMDADNRSLDAQSTNAVVERAKRDIELSSQETRDVLLCDLLCAAWGSVLAQNQ